MGLLMEFELAASKLLPPNLRPPVDIIRALLLIILSF